MSTPEPLARALQQERERLLRRVQQVLEKPMLLLAFVWLALFVLELVHGLGPQGRALGTGIWIVFCVDFALAFVIAPHKLAFLRRNWLTALSLLAPALRIARVARVLRLSRLLRVSSAARAARLLRLVSSLNRGMRALARAMRRRGFGYVSLLTVVVGLVGAAAMLSLEPADSVPGGFTSYGDALWWTAMILVSMGSDYWPQTPAGRLLCVLLALYALGVLGYIAATLATFFVGRDAEATEGEIAGSQELRALRRELGALRAELAQRAPSPGAPGSAGVGAEPPADAGSP